MSLDTMKIPSLTSRKALLKGQLVEVLLHPKIDRDKHRYHTKQTQLPEILEVESPTTLKNSCPLKCADIGLLMCVCVYCLVLCLSFDVRPVCMEDHTKLEVLPAVVEASPRSA